ncbi:MAG: methyltransferase [Candidatus Methanolliviera sp. GoM_oil]|nr:MAG: methyltransferase [Candidatus Methanolliviera sp. GoM_oil]
MDINRKIKDISQKIGEQRKNDEMTSYERLMTAFELHQPDRVPVTPFVRECCLHWIGKKFIDGVMNPELYAYAQLYSIYKLGYDMVLDLSAITAESEAMGSVIKFYEDAPPFLETPFIKNYEEDIPRLEMLDPHKEKTPQGTPSKLPLLLKMIKLEKVVCEEHGIPVMAYVQAPSRHASMLRGTNLLLSNYSKDPDHVKELFDLATESLKIWGEAVIHAGADILWISDPTGSGDMVSRDVFKKFMHPSLTELIRSLKRYNPRAKIFLHICGDVSDRLDLMTRTGIDAISIDQKVDISYAKRVTHDFLGVCLMGNIDPVGILQQGTSNDVKREAIRCINKGEQGGGYVLASGCILPVVSQENVEAMVKVAKTKGVYC